MTKFYIIRAAGELEYAVAYMARYRYLPQHRSENAVIFVVERK